MINMMVGYKLTVEPLSDQDGGGFLARFPELPGCASDGETPEEAALNARDALMAYLIDIAEEEHCLPEARVETKLA